MTDDYVSIKNFKHLYKLLKEYSEKKYNNKLDLKTYKSLIGNTINEISIKYENKKVDKKEKNIMTIIIIKNIIDKNNKKESDFFESDFENSNKQIRDIKCVNNYNINLNNVQYDNMERERERAYNKILRNDNHNLNTKIVKRDEEKFRKNLINDKQKFIDIEIKKNKKKNINEDIVIDPKKYHESLIKYKRKYDLLIDSRDREITLYNENNYLIHLDNPIRNIYSIELLNAIIPNSDYIINSSNNILEFQENNIDYSITIPIGNYSLTELGTELQFKLNEVGTSLYSVLTSNINSRINNLETNNDNIESNSNDSYKIFDSDLNSNWISTTLPSYIIYDFQKSVIINEYFILCTNVSYGKPTSFTIEISNDKTNWTVIDTQTSAGVALNRYKQISITNTLSSRYVKINITNSSDGQSVHITQLEFKSKVENRINISSDMSAGNFSLFFKKTTDTDIDDDGGKIKHIYRNNSIGMMIGFQANDYINYSNYTSDSEIVLDSDRNIYLCLQSIDNLKTTNQKLVDVFLKLTLDSDRNKYSFFKNENLVFNCDHLLHINKLLVQFKKYDNSLYNFNGLDHSMILRIKHYNTKHMM
jgi:hypothetical protein